MPSKNFFANFVDFRPFSTKFSTKFFELPARLFPNRHHPLHFVNQPLASDEGFASMWGHNFDPERRFVDLHHAHAMDEPDRFDRDLLGDPPMLVDQHILGGEGPHLGGMITIRDQVADRRWVDTAAARPPDC